MQQRWPRMELVSVTSHNRQQRSSGVHKQRRSMLQCCNLLYPGKVKQYHHTAPNSNDDTLKELQYDADADDDNEDVNDDKL